MVKYNMKNKIFNILKQAGRISLDEQKKMTVDVKSDKSIVTNGDLAVSKFLEEELKLAFPDHDIFSEENTTNKPKSNKVIVIDPIDGTESYSRKEDSWSILVGFLYDNKIHSGFVYQVSTGLLYYGIKGQGSFKVDSDGKETKLIAKNNGEKLALSSKSDYGEREFFNKLGYTKQEYSYSAALKIMKVAEGSADVFANFRKKCSLWDLVAPVAILNEAGGDIVYQDRVLYDFNETHINTNFVCYSKDIDSSVFFGSQELISPLEKKTKKEIFEQLNKYPQSNFAFKRKHDIHTGIDLYCNEGDSVLAMEDGVVMSFSLFTGENVSSPWWNETSAVVVKGASGYILYGELKLNNDIKVGDRIKAGTVLGNVTPVLKQNKNKNPVNMLHIELYNSEPFALEWGLNEKKPMNLLDPLVLISKIKKD